MYFDQGKAYYFKGCRVAIDLLIDQLDKSFGITCDLKSSLRLSELRNNANSSIDVLLYSVR